MSDTQPGGYVEHLQRENKRLRAQLRELREAQLGSVYDPVNQCEAEYRAETRE